ncbi:MAG: hypothetical protein IH945_04740 [Armatimonadetes bacterium]|nr:hypothetical protein [Armatimonadota bacterium]
MSVKVDPIVLNGAHGEGGGALLRTAVAMAALTQQPLRLHNVRGALRKPGVTSEDLTVIEAFADCSAARLDGAQVASMQFAFEPTRPPAPLRAAFDVHAHEKGVVPGNALIVLTSLLPVLARAGAYSDLTVRGETHNQNTIGYDAFERSTLALMRRFGLYVAPRLVAPGFGYGGHGEVAAEVEPSSLEPVDWPARGELRSVHAVVTGGDMPEVELEKAAKRIRHLADEAGLDIESETVALASRNKGATVTVWAEFETGIGSGTAALQRGGRIEDVADNAFYRFLEWYKTDATVDAFLADQVLLVAAQTDGRTVLTVPKITRRLTTMAWVVRLFMPIHITILGRLGEPGTLTIER